MPIPKPRENESNKAFMRRCMDDETMRREYPNADQRYAVCATQLKAAGDENRPAFITLEGEELEIQAAAGDGRSLPSFSMVAYNGGAMSILGFYNPVVVDLAGVQVEGQQLPVRLGHDSTRGVGHTTKIEILKGRIKAAGLISRSTSWARDVAESGKNGFPWKASIGVKIHKIKYLPPGQRTVVNGKSFSGPLEIVTSGTLKEISFVDSGADPTTSVSVAAKAAEENAMDAFEKWLKAGNIDVTTLSGDEKTRLKAQFDAEQEAGNTAPADSPAPSAAPSAAPAQAAQPEAPQTQTEPGPARASVQASDGGQTPQSFTAAASEFVAETRRLAAAEMRRHQEIARLCENGKYGEIQARAIEEGWDPVRCENEVNKLKLEELRASRPAAPAIHANSVDHGPQVFEAIALMASGMPMSRLEAAYQAPTLEAAQKLRGVGIQEFCELACGMQLPRFTRDNEGWLRAAFSTTSLPGILSNVANKMLLEGFNYVEDTWRKVCKIASVNDFKQHTRYRMTGSFTFQKVGQDGELKHGTVDEQNFTQQADTVRTDAPDDHQRRHGGVHGHPAPDRHGCRRGDCRSRVDAAAEQPQQLLLVRAQELPQRCRHRSGYRFAHGRRSAVQQSDQAQREAVGHPSEHPARADGPEGARTADLQVGAAQRDDHGEQAEAEGQSARRQVRAGQLDVPVQQQLHRLLVQGVVPLRRSEPPAGPGGGVPERRGSPDSPACRRRLQPTGRDVPWFHRFRCQGAGLPRRREDEGRKLIHRSPRAAA